ncbi:hypothetical protein EBQ91_02515 [bacterium]|jgi:hypothetical protein|nr:hypothetical protein [bacterium]
MYQPLFVLFCLLILNIIAGLESIKKTIDNPHRAPKILIFLFIKRLVFCGVSIILAKKHLLNEKELLIFFLGFGIVMFSSNIIAEKLKFFIGENS